MSFMFEVYYQSPPDTRREAGITERVRQLGGEFTYREEPEVSGGHVCLTYEFDQLSIAEHAASLLRQQGEHVEGPVDYGE